MKYLDQFRAARRSAAPIVVIRTADYASVIEEISAFYKGKEVPILQWDLARGIKGANDLGAQAALDLNANDQGQPAAIITGNPVEALQKALPGLPTQSILFMMNTQIILESKDWNRLGVIQGIWNCRDEFKKSKRTLVLLVPDMKVPPELSNDVITIDVPLPDREALWKLTIAQFKAAGLEAPKDDVIEKAVHATLGLSLFLAENAIAMSLSREGLDIDNLWHIKRSVVRQTSGLSVAENNTLTFDQIGGLEPVKEFCRFEKPSLTVLIDEFGDQLAGRNDSNGLNADAQATFLQSMEDNGWEGMILHGVAGTGKTEIGKAMGNESGGLFIKFDMGSMKGSLVSESERKIRAAVNILYAMGGREVFFIGTTNSLANITPQMMRRFTVIFFFDLLDRASQDKIWALKLKQYGLPDQPLPKYDGWTGAEINKCCRLAAKWKTTLLKASKFITPVVKAMGDDLNKMRKEAHGKYLSASRSGFYDMSDGMTESAINEIRQITMED